MKRLTLLFLLGALGGSAGEITLIKSAMLRADRNAISLKAGTVVELLSRDEKNLTIRYKNLTGTIPASSVTAAAEAPRKEEAKPTAPPAPPPPPPPRKAETTYGKAVEKARENAAKHDKNVVKPTDEILKE